MAHERKPDGIPTETLILVAENPRQVKGTSDPERERS